MGEYSIRTMESADIEGVLEIEMLCFSVPWSRESFRIEVEENRCAIYVVAVQGGRIDGYGGMWTIIDEAHVTNIAVHPVHRRKGLGEAILKALMRRALDIGIRRMTLEVRVSNKAARNLYQKFGFSPAGIRKQYYADNKEDALIMWNLDITRVL